MVTVALATGEFAVVPVTVENGEPLDYRQKKWGKGRQLAVDSTDFPTLAQRGLHAVRELEWTRTITQRSVGIINELGRPGRLSSAGFLGNDENIASVLKADNRLVQDLGLTHPQLAKPLFHVWNLILAHAEHDVHRNTIHLLYNGKNLALTWEGSRGWQESLFADEILGMYRFQIQRELDDQEKALLRRAYPELTAEEMKDFVTRLSCIHTSEMVPYYVTRYGFYEGHTEYRADPIAIAYVFGIKSLSEIEAVFSGRLPASLTTHSNSPAP
jgi:hypothetical protein